MNEQDTRRSILDAARAELDEAEDMDRVTMRKIAERAQVAVGLINYHFQSKEKLLSLAIGDVMSEKIAEFDRGEALRELPPVERLKALLRDLYALAEEKPKLIRFVLQQELLNGNMQTALLLLPMLREVFGCRRDDMQLRLIALELLCPIQVTALNIPAFHLYSGIDLNDPREQSRFIDLLVDELTKEVTT